MKKINSSVFSQLNLKKRSFVNNAMRIVTACAFLIVSVPLLDILFEVLANGISTFSFSLLTKAGSNPLSSSGGIGHAFIGTLLVLLIAVTIGIPLGLSVGIYLGEFGDNIIGIFLRVCVETMATIPTIITGVIAYLLIVQSMGTFSIIAGGFALALIMIPIVARITDEMIRLVPDSIREASYALGLDTGTTVTSIVVPNAGKGITSGILLALARILGETAPLLFTVFFSQSFPKGINRPAATLTVLIFQYSISPFEEWQKLAWAAAMFLLLINLALITLVRSMFRKSTKR